LEQRFLKLTKDGLTYSKVNNLNVFSGAVSDLREILSSSVEEAMAITYVSESIDSTNPISLFFITGQKRRLFEVFSPSDLVAGANITLGPWRILQDLKDNLWVVGHIYREATKQEEEEVNIQESIRLWKEAEHIASPPESEQELIRKIKESFEQLRKQLKEEEVKETK
jgi:hypothetical protein